VRVASIPAVLLSPALSPQQHAPPISAFAAATAAADGSSMPADSAEAPQTDGYPPSSAGAPDAESVDGALSAVTVSPPSHHLNGKLVVILRYTAQQATHHAASCLAERLSSCTEVACHAAAPPKCNSECSHQGLEGTYETLANSMLLTALHTVLS